MNQDELHRCMDALQRAPQGQQLMALLGSDGGASLRRAADALNRGDENAAQQAMAPFLSDPRIQSLLTSLNQTLGHG